MLKQLVENAVNMRLYTQSNGIGAGKDPKVQQWAMEFKTWLAFNKRAKEEVVIDFLKRRWYEFTQVCPGSKGGQKILDKVKSIVLP